MTALDAGFWTAMRIKTRWLRDICSVVFTLYYLVAAERADEKVRRVRATITVDHMRVSWNKSTTPYLKFLTNLLHPAPNKFAPRHIRIPRPKESVYRTPIDAWIYFEGTREELQSCKKLVLDFPGGGFVAMSPRHYDDKLLCWARRCPGIPIIAVDYKHAPEFPYPYALNECYDTYHSIAFTRGKCIGLSGDILPRIALSGDSAGGNYAAGVTLMILNSTSTSSTGHLMEEGWKGLPLPDGLVLIYPSLDLNIGSWMSDDQMKLIRQRGMRKTNKNVVKRKSEYFERASGIEPAVRPNEDDEGDSDGEPLRLNGSVPVVDEADQNVVGRAAAAVFASADTSKPKPLLTRLAMTSRLSYFNDRILTPEMMRAMVILYIGPHNRPDFTTDFLLSPIVAPESLLARFPKTFFLTGERDPLVDDTVIFAGRIRQAKQAVWRHRRDMGLERGNASDDGIEVSLIPGISHGFLQMGALYPEAAREINRCARWLRELLEDKPGEYEDADGEAMGSGERRKHERSYTGGSMTSGDEDRPLEMAPLPGRERTRANGTARGRGRGRRGSNVTLGSEVDLVGRRMQGLAGGLTAGIDDEVEDDY